MQKVTQSDPHYMGRWDLDPPIYALSTQSGGGGETVFGERKYLTLFVDKAQIYMWNINK